MRIEAARFQMTRVDTELVSASEKLKRTQQLIYRLQETLRFLESPGARIVSIAEYRAMGRELKALINDSNTLTGLIRTYRFGQDTLKKEIGVMSKELEDVGSKVLRFTRRD
jgi:hypothetical protein